MPSPGEWYSSLPPISKTWGSVLLAGALLHRFGLLDVTWLALSFPLVFRKFQVWRLLTAFLFEPLGLGLLFDLLMIAQCGVKLEQDQYAGRPADFLFLLMFGVAVMLPCTLLPFFALPLLGPALVMMVVYVWCRANPNASLGLFGVVSVPAFYYPWVLVGLTLLMGGQWLVSLLGCLVGHLYYFLDTAYPHSTGRTFLVTPAWVHWLGFKWAQNAPDMFPDSARLPPDVQRIHLRRPQPGAPPAGGAGAPPAGTGGTPASAGAQGGQGRPAAAQPSSQAFRGRSYRLDRD